MTSMTLWQNAAHPDLCQSLISSIRVGFGPSPTPPRCAYSPHPVLELLVYGYWAPRIEHDRTKGVQSNANAVFERMNLDTWKCRDTNVVQWENVLKMLTNT